MKTKRFVVIFPPEYEDRARYLLCVLETNRLRIKELTGGDIGRVNVVVQDIGAISNAYAMPLYNTIGAFTYPPNSDDFSGLGRTMQDWYREIGIHEYTHLAHLNVVGGIPKILNTLWGKLWLPNFQTPLWMIEGIAVYAESMTSEHEGRLNDGMFDAYVRAVTKEKRFPSLLRITNLTPFEFPGYTMPYLYGGKFVKYLVEKYGESKIKDFFARCGRTLVVPFWIDRCAKEAFGKSLPDLYEEWQEYESQTNKNTEIEGKKITFKEWYHKSPVVYDGKIYFYREYPVKTGPMKGFRFTEIVKQDLVTMEEKVIIKLPTEIVGLIKIKNNILYYLIPEIGRGYSNSDFLSFGIKTELFAYNLKTKKHKKVLEGHIRAFDFINDNEILYSLDNRHTQSCQLYKFSLSDKKHMLLMDTDYIISEIAVNNSGNIALCARKDGSNWDIFFLDLKEKNITPLTLTDESECDVVWVDEKLFFSANYGKVWQIYFYSIKDKKFYKVTDTNFAVSPAYYQDNIYFIGLDSGGFSIYRKKLTDVEEFTLPSPKPKKEQEVIPIKIRKGNYLDIMKPLIFPPAIHFIWPYPWICYLHGTDATSENSYIFVWSYMRDEKINRYKNSVSFRISSISFKPLVFGFSTSFDEIETWRNSIEIDFHYPLLNRLKWGFSSIWLGCGTKIFGDKLLRKELIPKLNFGLNFHTLKIIYFFKLMYESKQLGSEINRIGYFGKLFLRQYIIGSELNLLFESVLDRDNPSDWVFQIRGYDQFYIKEGFRATLEYKFPLIKIREGWIPPGLKGDLAKQIDIRLPPYYFEDVCVNIFADYLRGRNENQASIGAELVFETKIFYHFNVFPKIGYVYTKEKVSKIYYSFYAVF